MTVDLGTPTFVVDLNEITDGDLLPVSMDYTTNYGPRVLVSHFAMPGVGDQVMVSDDDALYHAQVVRLLSARDFEVRIGWDTCQRTLNREWP